MKNIVKEENVIFIALVYNWLANQKMELREFDISSFLNAVNDYLRQNFNISIAMDYYSNQDVENNYLYDKIKEMIEYKYDYKLLYGVYKLKTLENVDYIYGIQPEEVIKATLQKEALSSINVSREDLEIETDYRYVSNKTGIYTLEGRRALEIVREDLERKGCISIEMGHPIPDQLDGDKGFYVSYTCREPVERVNVLVKK